jgi:hypothetical protein
MVFQAWLFKDSPNPVYIMVGRGLGAPFIFKTLKLISYSSLEGCIHTE